MPLEEDLLAEGEPEREYVPGIANRFARKRATGGALTLNEAEPLLKPSMARRLHLASQSSLRTGRPDTGSSDATSDPGYDSVRGLITTALRPRWTATSPSAFSKAMAR